jgi:hypothetical protein
MTPRTLAKKCETVCDMLEQIKEEYKLVDALMEEIVKAENEGMDIPDGYTLTDEFAGKVVLFRATAFRRYKLVRTD